MQCMSTTPSVIQISHVVGCCFLQSVNPSVMASRILWGTWPYFFKSVRSDHYGVSTHVGALWPEDGSVSIRLLVMNWHCVVDESFNNIHKCYKGSYINTHFAQGFLSV
jgi:hypothetical protein